MRYTFCEALLFSAMDKTVFRFLGTQYPDADLSLWRKKSKARYREIIAMVDDIGSMMQNPLRVSLSGGAVWLAVFETAPTPMKEEVFGQMVVETMKAPLFQKAFKGKKPFSLDKQRKKAEKDKAVNALTDSPFSWQVQTIPGRDDDEYTTIYTRCGLCGLGKKLGHPELVPLMCRMDYLSIDLMGGVLHRTKTLAAGDDCCDFYVCKKGSKWDVSHPEEGQKAPVSTEA